MTYPEALDFLYSRLPMFQRTGPAAYKNNLDSVHKLMAVLDHPERKFKAIHVAGTNGKGSTCHILASVLQEAGLKVGLYTSPHLKDFRERVRINGQMISEDEVLAFVTKHKSAFEELDLSFFEWTVGLAYTYFVDQKVDIAVIETGMGGRLDATNVITPILSVITNIGHDHMQFLGDNISAIAIEKAGIIKRDVPVVIGETNKYSAPAFIRRAKVTESPIYFADQVKQQQGLETDLLGDYQKKNMQTAIIALAVLQRLGIKLPPGCIKEGLKHVSKNTGLLGRWQVLQQSPLVVADTGHNPEGMAAVLRQIHGTPHQKLHFVFGTVNDKAPESILKLLPTYATFYWCKADLPRAMDANNLQLAAESHELKGEVYNSVAEAVEAAKAAASAHDMVFIGGSTFVVAEAL